jgi:hypothetical protein
VSGTVLPGVGAISSDCWTSLAGSSRRPAVAASRARLRGPRQSPMPIWAPGGWPVTPIPARACDSTSREARTVTTAAVPARCLSRRFPAHLGHGHRRRRHRPRPCPSTPRGMPQSRRPPGVGWTVDFLSDSDARTIDSVTGFAAHLPVGVSEVRLEGADDLRTPLDPTRTVAVPCGFGPTVRVDGTQVPTQVVGTVEQVLRGQPLRWSACMTAGESSVSLEAGRHTPRRGLHRGVPALPTLLRRVDAARSVATAPSAPEVLTEVGTGQWARAAARRNRVCSSSVTTPTPAGSPPMGRVRR